MKLASQIEKQNLNARESLSVQCAWIPGTLDQIKLECLSNIMVIDLVEFQQCSNRQALNDLHMIGYANFECQTETWHSMLARVAVS